MPPPCIPRLAGSKSMALRAFPRQQYFHKATDFQQFVAKTEWFGQDWTGSSSSSKKGQGRKNTCLQVLRSEDPYTHADEPLTATQFRESDLVIRTSTPRSSREVQMNTLPHPCCFCTFTHCAGAHSSFLFSVARFIKFRLCFRVVITLRQS